MAKHVITIRDEGTGIAVNLKSEGSKQTVAGLTALSLIDLIAKVLPEAQRRAVCSCAKCTASRMEPSPTVH